MLKYLFYILTMLNKHFCYTRNMDIRILHYFVTIAQEKNITRAAERLLITQPTLSRQLKDFEDKLNVSLFHRANREMTLTEDGQYLYNRAQEILQLVSKTEENLTRKGEIGGDLHIGTAETASFDLIADACRSLLEIYPQIRLNLYDDNADSLYEKLDKGILDFAFVFARNIPTKYKTIQIPQRDRWGVLVPNNHPLTKLEQVTVEDIVAYPILVSNQSDLDKTFLRHYDYSIVATYNLLYTASRLVKAGIGIAICLDGIIDNPNLKFIPLNIISEEKFYLIWREQHDQTATQKAFLEEIEAQLYEIKN